MKRYSNYRDSGLAFVEKIPQHWDVKRAKSFFYEIDERSQNGDEELLSVSHITGVTPRSEKNITMFMAESYEGYKTCIPNDLIINIMWAWMGALGVSKYQGIISSAYGVYRQKNTNNFYNDYLEYLVRIPEYIAEYTRRSKGIRSSRLRMYSDDFFQIPIICPPIEEQKQIARFLDRKLEQINHFITNKQRLIELLKEQKTAIVNRAVTKGLNPHAPMKPSGIKWLGEIPAHWNVKRLKYLVSMQGGYAFSSNYFTDTGIQLIKIGNLYQNQLCLDRDPTFLPRKFLAYHPSFVVTKGDILMSLTGTLGKRDYGFAVLLNTEEKFLLNQRVAKLSVKNPQEIITEYVALLLRCEFYLNQLFSQPSGTKQANLSDYHVLCPFVIFPPTINEQEEILKFMQKKILTIDSAITKAEKEIELIQEYRTTLISDAVTGRIDVRETSAVEPTLTAAAI